MATPSTENHLLWYLEKYLSFKGSMELTTEHLDSQHQLPWHKETCLFVLAYVVQFCSNADHSEFSRAVEDLDEIAKSVHASYTQQHEQVYEEDDDAYRTTQSQEDYVDEINKKQREFTEMLVNSFVPDVVPNFFKVLKPHQLSVMDKHLNPNEILAAFFDFLLQVLHHEGNIFLGDEQLQASRVSFALVQKQLSFFLAVLGDLPFQPTNLGLEEQVNNILEEFLMLANEAGSFIYACVFPVRPVDVDWFRAETSNLLEKAELLNTQIKLHCIMFSELPMSVISRSAVVDSFFIIDSLIVDIENLENREFNFPVGNDQIGVFKHELYSSKSLIKVTDQIPWGTRAEEKEVLIQIRDLTYQAEYLINSHVVGNILVWYLNLRLHSIVQEIKIINVRLRQLVKKVQDSNVLIKASGGEASSRTLVNVSTMDDHKFLTFNDDMEKNILRHLIRRLKSSREIIVLHGMPGLGKTTTATKLYNRQEVSEYFDPRAWCIVSQDYSLRALFVQILRFIAPQDHIVLEKETAELGESIYENLRGRRYLIVLDDVWESSVLDKMIRYLPDDRNGSRVIVTSRVKDVAPYDSILYTLPLLSNDQCWELLKKKVFSNPEKPCPMELEDAGKRIAEKCYGIPLAVVNTAGILVHLEKETSVWESVADQLAVLLWDDQNNFRKTMELSYEHLPRNLKPCFLYFATFPEDAEISTDELTWHWMAQGFIPKDRERSPEETAEMYFLDLINISLVVPVRRGSDGRTRTCRIHDLWHDMCVAKANEENFIKSTNVFSIYEKHEGLNLQSTSDKVLRPFDHHCRSLRGFHTYMMPFHRTMALLKTVELPPKDSISDMYPNYDLPVQLRYLGIDDLQERTVANLVNLEFIHVRSEVKVYVPSVILRMVKLRHLLVTREAEFEDCSNITEATNLRSLSNVCINGKKDEDILRHSPHLQKLKCRIVGGETILFPDLSALGELESLRMDYEESFNGKILLSEFSFPLTIKKLCLSGSKLPWKMTSIIGKLPGLEVLKLENNAFVGEKWETKADEFELLRFLKIDRLDLKQLSSKSDPFPRLQQLVMHNCWELEEIPIDIGYLLERIDLQYCGSGAISLAERIEEEQHVIGNTEFKLLVDKTKEQAFVMSQIELHDMQALTDPPSTENLSHYVKEHVRTGDQHLPWNWNTCSVVVHYVMQFLSNLDHHSEFYDVVMGLVRIARSYWERHRRLKGYSNYRSETEKKQGEFSELFVNSFIPKAHKFYKVLKLDQLSEKDKHLNLSETLAAFFNIVIQVLHCEENISSTVHQFYALLQNQLSFLLAVLGDIPFQPTHPGLEEQVNNILEEFELLANEVGSFVYSCVFSVCPVDADWFSAEAITLLAKAELLNDNIRNHCNVFSELPMSVIPRSSVVDSFFIIDSLINDIENLEIRFIINDDGKRNQIGMLKDELNISKSIIRDPAYQIPQDADANEHKEALINIRDLAYQAEYLISSYVVGNIPAWYLNLRLPTSVQQIQNNNERLQQLVKKMQHCNVTENSDGEASSGPLVNPAATIDYSDFLAFNVDREKNILEDILRRSIPSREIILICGMPGLGKTTTATDLYNHHEISEHFNRRAWCIVSQTYRLRALFLQILRDIAPDDNTVLEKETSELGVSIHKTLKKQRYLIVLDDVWDSSVLDKLKLYFPDEKNGSRLLVTSRVRDVAPVGSKCHELLPLSRDHCWGLLTKNVFHKESCPPELDYIGRQIAEKCCGVPLAVVNAAGILAHLEKKRSVWERVGKQLDVLLLDDKSNYRKILELSYEHLPRDIKPCFLYFAAFPEDAEISKKELTWHWMAQGFIPNDGKKSREETAEMYFVDLINRSLVLPGKRGSDGRIRTCKIHDLLHDICVVKADEENFMKSTNVFSMYENHQGLCIPSASDIVLGPFSHHCRSFRDFHTYQSSYFPTMALLKTVELPPGDSNDYPRFDLPIQLRYLGIGELQKRTVANLVKLEFIHVKSKERVYVPSVILRMVKLEHLLIRPEAEFEEDCSSNMKETTNLRSISYVCIKRKKDEDILRQSPHLQKIKCICRGEVLFPDLSALRELNSLRIDYEESFSSKIVLTEGSFPSTIKKLCLKESKLAWEKMSTIGKLPNLEVLKLERKSFVGEEWETEDDQFIKLRFLKIYGLDLKEWSTESDHFPRLEQLVMHDCWNIKEIPSDFGLSQSLKTIELRGWSRISTEEMEKVQCDNGNTQLQVYSYRGYDSE